MCQLHSISDDSVSSGEAQPSASRPPETLSSEQLPSENLSAALDQKIVSPNRVLVDSSCFARVVVGFPDLMVRRRLAGEAAVTSVGTFPRDTGHLLFFISPLMRCTASRGLRTCRR